MVWSYNAFLSHEVKSVEEERVWSDSDIANLAQVEVNAFFLQNSTPAVSEAVEQMKFAELLYTNAKELWKDDTTVKEAVLDRRA